MDSASISSLIQKLRKTGPFENETALIGFDGYIDYIQKVVRNTTRKSRRYFENITQMSEHILAAAGKSAQLELRTLAVKMGGNAPIMSHALGSLGTKNYCAGMLGDTMIHPVFKVMHPNCELISLGPSATSNALEFDDGKLILSEVSTFDDLDWEYISKSEARTKVLDGIRESKLIAMVDWSNLPKCTSLWVDLFKIISKKNWKDKIFFFDLCDPSKNSRAEITSALEAVGQYSKIGETVLGLNENEALKVYRALFDKPTPESANLIDTSQAIFDALSIDALLVHPVDRSILIKKETRIEVKGRVVQHPKILTGGGDNLNAGFCFGRLNNFTDEECLLTAMATSGAYVANGFSPDTEQLTDYLKNFNRA